MSPRCRLNPGTPHGTVSTYTNYGCRCPSCTEANRQQAADWAERAQERLDEAPHGTESGYVNWGCRCGPCKAAGKNARSAKAGAA